MLVRFTPTCSFSGAGKLFDIDVQSQYVDTLISKVFLIFYLVSFVYGLEYLIVFDLSL